MNGDISTLMRWNE